MTIAVVSSFLVSCGEFEWETVAVERLDDNCVTARSMINGVWNRPVFEILYHDDCENLDRSGTIVYLHGSDRDVRMVTIDRTTLAVSTYWNSQDRSKQYFVFSTVYLPKSTLEMDYRTEPNNVRIVAADAAGDTEYEVVTADEWHDVQVLRIGWPADYSSRNTSVVYFLSAEECRYSFTEDGEILCDFRWRGADDTTTFLIRLPVSESGFLDFQTQ